MHLEDGADLCKDVVSEDLVVIYNGDILIIV